MYCFAFQKKASLIRGTEPFQGMDGDLFIAESKHLVY